MNQDDVVNGLDVDPFVAAVVGGGVQAVKPGTGGPRAVRSGAERLVDRKTCSTSQRQTP